MREKEIMKTNRRFILVVALTAAFLLHPAALIATDIDWFKIKSLKDRAFLEYVETLDLRGEASLRFWKKIPLSRANPQVYKLFHKEAFAIYMNRYPRPRGKLTRFEAGQGTTIIGPKSNQPLKLLFTDYYPLAEGPVGDPEKRYQIGYTIHGHDHPWLGGNAETAIWEARRHPNVDLTLLDPEFVNQKQVEQIDAWVKEGFDGILIWPLQEAPTGAPVERALKKGVPCVSIDRMVGTPRVTARITGNFPANGAQQGVYLIHRLLQEKGEVKGNILLIRKPLGSTADAMRTGHFLKVISYFPGLKILDSYHNNSNREHSFNQVRHALTQFPIVDAIFCTGAEQGMGAVRAVDDADRWHSREDNQKIIVLVDDDLSEALTAIQKGKIAMVAPYTPLLGALGLRVLLKIITGKPVPKDVVTPDLPMITKESENVFGIETVPVEQWTPYAYGRK